MILYTQTEFLILGVLWAWNGTYLILFSIWKNCQLKKKTLSKGFNHKAFPLLKKYKHICYLRRIKRLLAHASQPKFITLDLS